MNCVRDVWQRDKVELVAQLEDVLAVEGEGPQRAVGQGHHTLSTRTRRTRLARLQLREPTPHRRL
jgi:hypothetical protein